MRKERINEIAALVLLTAALFIFLSLATFDPADIPLYSANPNSPVNNLAGAIGSYTSGVLFFLIGIGAYLIPILLAVWAINRFFKATSQYLWSRIAGTAIVILSSSILASIIRGGEPTEEFRMGGVLGYFLSKVMLRYLGHMGSYLILAVLFFASLVLATDFMIFPMLVKLKNIIVLPFRNLKAKAVAAKTGLPKPTALRRPKESITAAGAAKPSGKDKVLTADARAAFKEKRELEVTIHKPQKVSRSAPGETAKKTPKKEFKEGEFLLPSLNLLDSPPPVEERKIEDDLKTNSEVLESTLLDFGIEAKVVKVEQGPVITRYELEPAPGVKISRITNLSDNISLVMKAQSVRIVAPIPGKGTIGIEVPNSSSSVVYFREVLDSDEFKDSSTEIPLALGKEITGKSVVADLAEMPHLLIAGTTGSGKTVCVNCLIMSMLYKMKPDEVKFLMVDPKMVELAVFNGLPHLLCPIVTDSKKAAASLNWVVNEMERRYKLLAHVAARNIDVYNEKINEKEDLSGDEGEPLEKLPYIVVIIDELADLMIVAKDSIENSIMRLAQLSRAVGIHIILATQRPSVDVITGVIKANFPARVSFKVASKVDSRTVLDINGADKLLGRGDMLFIEPGATKPVRAQGSLIKDSEIERIANFLKKQADASYDEEIMSQQEKKSSGKTLEKDELFEEAVKIVFQTKQASVSMLQRKLGLGYTRAARLIDAMEDEGIVGPYRGSKPREILVDAESESPGS